MSTKTLKINPNLFSLNKGGSKKDKVKKPTTKVKTSKVRDAFIQKRHTNYSDFDWMY